MTAPIERKEVDGTQPTTTKELGNRLFGLLGEGFYISADEEDDDFRRVVKADDLDEGNDGEVAFVLHTAGGEKYEVLVTRGY